MESLASKLQDIESEKNRGLSRRWKLGSLHHAAMHLRAYGVALVHKIFER